MHDFQALRARRGLRRLGIVVAATGVAAVVVIELADGPSRRAPAPDRPPPPSGPVAPGGRALFVSPQGSDEDRGTRRSPLRTLAHALTRVTPGDAIVLRAGAYGARGTTTRVRRSGTEGAPIEIRSQPGDAPPRVLGNVEITGDHVHVSGLVFDGPTGPVKGRSTENPGGEDVVVAVGGDDVAISHSVVRKGAWHAGIFVEDADRTRIVANHIHDNGVPGDPAHANRDHGIYWQSGSGLIANNVIERNVARGIQLYPDASDVVVTNNTVVDNGRAGIQVAEDSDDNQIVNNIVAFNEGSGIRSADLDGDGNEALHNLVWGNAEGDIGPEIDGLEVSDVIRADPRLKGGGDPCPAKGSPAIDRALARHSPPRDYFGRERRRYGTPDLGACESTEAARATR